MPYVVTVAMTIDTEDPDMAIEFVRRELDKLSAGDPPWQSEAPHLLPRWQIASVRRATKLDERGFPAE
jgi:hypothetical protein